MKEDLKLLKGWYIGMFTVLIIDAFVASNFWTVFFATIGVNSLLAIVILKFYKK